MKEIRKMPDIQRPQEIPPTMDEITSSLNCYQVDSDEPLLDKKERIFQEVLRGLDNYKINHITSEDVYKHYVLVEEYYWSMNYEINGSYEPIGESEEMLDINDTEELLKQVGRMIDKGVEFAVDCQQILEDEEEIVKDYEIYSSFAEYELIR